MSESELKGGGTTRGAAKGLGSEDSGSDPAEGEYMAIGGPGQVKVR